MTLEKLVSEIKRKKSFLCVGLDVDLNKIPSHLLSTEDPIFEFNKQIIDATHHLAVAYKPNIAFFEAYGVKGWKSLEKTITYINVNYPEIFTIADAKRGDIGNTSTMYAKAFFEDLNFDSVTVAPYMGSDSVEPFLAFNEKLMFVVGATKAEYFKGIREIAPNSFLLVPGVGAQGGSLKDVCEFGINKENIGLLINSSRGIIYASQQTDFANAAALEALKLQQQMEAVLMEKEVL